MFCYWPSKLFLHRSMDRAPICKIQKAKKIRKENHGESRGTRTHSFIPLLLSNLRFKSEKKESWVRRVPTLNRILNMCSQPSFVVLGTLKEWYLVILRKDKQWAIFFIDYGTHFFDNSVILTSDSLPFFFKVAIHFHPGYRKFNPFQTKWAFRAPPLA